MVHVLLVIPVMSGIYAVGKAASSDPDVFSAPWWLQRTPLRFLWAGHCSPAPRISTGPVWSLRWRVWFSILLPVMFFVLRAVRVQRWWALAVPLLAAVTTLSSFPGVTVSSPGSFVATGLVQVHADLRDRDGDLFRSGRNP